MFIRFVFFIAISVILGILGFIALILEYPDPYYTIMLDFFAAMILMFFMFSKLIINDISDNSKETSKDKIHDE
jgi:hypothetical protein